MHVLTKVFIVIVSLLAVMLVPLVITYASNENTYKSMLQSATDEAQAARAALASAEARHASAESDLKSQIQVRESEISNLRSQTTDLRSTVRQLQTDLAEVRAEKAGVQAHIATFATALQGNQEINSTLLAELSSLRRQALTDAEQVVQLDHQLRDVQSRLEVALAASRALQEEVERMRQQEAALTEQVGLYVASFGELGDPDEILLTDRSIAPDRNLTANVINVRRSEDETLVELNVGSRDGVKVGWSMIIGSGSNFIANVRIIEVDISTSVGLVSLEDPRTRGSVQVGHTVYARRGER